MIPNHARTLAKGLGFGSDMGASKLFVRFDAAKMESLAKKSAVRRLDFPGQSISRISKLSVRTATLRKRSFQVNDAPSCGIKRFN